MVTNRHENNQEDQRSPWLGFAKALFIVCMTVILFLLVNSMVRYHFLAAAR
jgi:hypothetical protein